MPAVSLFCRAAQSIKLASQLALSCLNFVCTLFHAELAAYADGQGITKDGKRVDQLGNQLSKFLSHIRAKSLVCAAATAWLRNTEAFKNRKSLRQESGCGSCGSVDLSP